MTADFLRRAVRDGPQSSDSIPIRALALYLHWRTWACGGVLAVTVTLAIYSMALFDLSIAWALVFACGWACCEWTMRLSPKYDVEQRY